MLMLPKDLAEAIAYLTRFRCPHCVNKAVDMPASICGKPGEINQTGYGWKCSRYRSEMGAEE